jgi:hypothetical protein
MSSECLMECCCADVVQADAHPKGSNGNLDNSASAARLPPLATHKHALTLVDGPPHMLGPRSGSEWSQHGHGRQGSAAPLLHAIRSRKQSVNHPHDIQRDGTGLRERGEMHQDGVCRHPFPHVGSSVPG